MRARDRGRRPGGAGIHNCGPGSKPGTRAACARRLHRLADRCGASDGGIRERPARPAPRVRPGLERRHRGDVGLRGPVLEVLGEEGRQDVPAELPRRVGVELDRAERVAVGDHLPVMLTILLIFLV